MPANLTPEYFKAEKWYREAKTPDEKILALERMLAVMPKHKGTDHLKADLRRKLSKLREGAQQKGKASVTDIFHVPRSGAGQIVLLGTPNCGKSSIVAALTNAKVNVAEFVAALKGTDVRILPSLGTYEQNVTVAEMRRRAHAFYSAGANGLSRWDTYSQLARLRLDDPEQQRLWVEEYFPPQRIKLLEFAGQNLRAYGPMLGF